GLQRCMKAESIMRARERMSGTLMHSLKGPIHAMTLTLDVLRKRSSKETRQRHYLDALGRELSRLNDSLEAMFAESRPARMMTEFDLTGLISELATGMRVETALREVTIKLNLAEQTTMLGRQRDIKHALAAIMLNSLDASPDGGEVEVKLTREDHWARITISGDPSTESSLDIDLEVARQIAREHGGELYSDSSRRICFKLPLKEQK
ncbi:MAG: sensor histidine kinase, partial [Burkholderiales bacterium]